MKNRLEIVLAANDQPLKRSLQGLRQDVNAFSKDVSSSLERAGDGAETLSRVVEDVADSFKEVEKESSDLGRSLTQEFKKGSKEAQELDQVLDRLDQAFRDLAQRDEDILDLERALGRIQAEAKQLEQEVKDLEKAFNALKSSDPSSAVNFQTGIQSAQQLQGNLEKVSGQILSTAEESRALARAIQQAFSNPKQAEQFVKIAKDLQDAYGELISADDLGQAIKRLDTLQAATQDAGKNVERIVKLALDSGKDLESAADDAGEFLANLNSGNFDAGVGESLRANFGIAAEALRAYGAEVDTSGKLLADTRAQQEKAQTALKRYIDESDRFKNVATRNKDAQAELSDEFGKFSRSVGEQVNVLKNFVAEGLLGTVKGFNNLSEGSKKTVAAAALLTPVLGGLAIGGAQLASVFTAFLKPAAAVAAVTGRIAKGGAALGGILKTITSGATSAAGALGALGGLAASAGALLIIGAKGATDVAQANRDAENATGAYEATLARAILRNREAVEASKLSEEQLRREISAVEDLTEKRNLATNAVLAAQKALSDAQKDGTSEEVKAAEERLRLARELRNQVDADRKAEADTIAALQKAESDRFRAAREEYKQFKTDFDNGQFDSQKKALEALEGIASGLTGEPLQEAQKEIRRFQQSILSEELATLNKRVQNEEVTAQKSSQILDELLRKYEANADQRRKAEESFGEAVEAVAEKRLQRTEALLAKELELERSAVQQKRQILESGGEVAVLESRLAKGEDVVDQIKAELTERSKVLKTYIDEEAAIQRLVIEREKAAAVQADPSNAAEIEKQAAERQRQLNVQVANDKKKLDNELAQNKERLDRRAEKIEEDRAKKREEKRKKEAKLEENLTSLQRQRFELEQQSIDESLARRRQALAEEETLGVNVVAQRKKLEEDEKKASVEAAKERFRLAKQEAEARQKAADVGASEAEKRVNAERAALEILRAQKTAKEDLQKIEDSSLAKKVAETEELRKQLQILKDQTSEKKTQNGFDTQFGNVSSDASPLGTSGLGEKAEREPSDFQQRREIRRRERELESRNNANQIERRQGEKRTEEAAKELSGGDSSPTAASSPQPSIDSSQLLSAIQGLTTELKSLPGKLAQSQTRQLRQPSNLAQGLERGSPRMRGLA